MTPLVSSAAPRRFEAAKQETHEELSNSNLLPVLLYNVLITMREHLRGMASSPADFDERLLSLPAEVPQRANVLSAQLLAADFKLQWGASSDSGHSTPKSLHPTAVAPPPEAGFEAQLFVREIVQAS